MDAPRHPPAQPTGDKTAQTAPVLEPAPQLLSRADQIAQAARSAVERQGSNVQLMKPPNPQETYHTQTLSLTLYRRNPGSYPPKPYAERRVDFADGTGYILIEGSNVDLESLHIGLKSDAEGWDININPVGKARPLAEAVRGGEGQLKRMKC
jgi:hypothetical protein